MLLPRSQINGALGIAVTLLSIQTVRKEGSPKMLGLLHDDIARLKEAVATKRSMDDPWNEEVLRQKWWKMIPYM